MPQTSLTTRLRAEQQELQQIEQHLEGLNDQLKERVLADDEAAIAKLDADIAWQKRKAEHHKLRIDSLRAQQALEQTAAATKQLVERIESACKDGQFDRVAHRTATTQNAELIGLVL
jgi:Skp family chaperone for outer membrane proteins